MDAEQWLLAATIFLLVVTLVVVGVTLVELRAVRFLARSHGGALSAEAEQGASAGPLIAFIANPSKPSVASLKGPLLSRCLAQGLPDPLWLETTVEDPGGGQARDAIARGADIVVAVGGDGTVRAVASHMTNTSTPMGIIPVGTGNLLARNLDISVSSVDDAFQVILEGTDRRIDVGWLQVVEPDVSVRDRLEKVAAHGRTPMTRRRAQEKLDAGEGLPADTEKHLFLVISGVGFDAAMIADADATLKAKVGWVAYFVAGMRHLHGNRLNARISLDGRRFQTQLRTLLVGNCGKLPGGITLIPDAIIDDGVHDVAAIDTRGGIAGWVQLFGEVVLQGYGLKNELPTKVGRIDHIQARTVEVSILEGAQAQVDGDIVGRARCVRTWVEPHALIVRAPLPSLNLR
ncbi:diacylglycerol/lipid kinase family protein [Timonella sp. A28]|uniref:diacylglycerol/lipid kinase family protein n=1 Tax=Timonella sp. A28 TaxID=3442640 RepID=UPI003EBEF7DF